MIIQETPQNSSNLNPGVGSSYGNGIAKLGKYFLYLLLIVLVSAAFGIPSCIAAFLTYTDLNYAIVSVLLYAYSFFVLAPVEYGMSFAFLKAARDEQPSVADLGIVLKNYWNIFFATILVGIIVSVGFFLFIIPGVYFAVKLSFVRYLVTDEKMSVLQAIDESWKRTAGYGWTIFFMGLLAIPVMFAGFLLFGIGAILSAMWIEAAFASLFAAVTARKNQAVIEPEPSPQGPFI